MKISVIIPVYNAAPYVRTTLDSVIAAAKRLQEADPSAATEVICVDDGSTDGSGALLDAFPSTFNLQPSTFTIRVLHQANAGVSAARNAGMAAATGELVTFLDADDTYDVRALEVLADVWRKTGAEVIRYGCNTVSDHVQDVPLVGDPRFDAVDLDAETASPLRRCSLGWATVISARLGKTVRWPALTHCEDPLFALRCMKASRKNVFVDAALANYLIRPGSAARTVSLKIVAATCRYLVMAYDECASMPGFATSCADTCVFLSGFLTGPLRECWKRFPKEERAAIRHEVTRAEWSLSIRSEAFPPPRRPLAYDLAVPLGITCASTQVLRDADLQFASFPLDWIGFSTMRKRTDWMVEGRADMIRADRLKRLPGDGCDVRHNHYADEETGCWTFHDFEKGKSVDEAYPAIQRRLDRRMEHVQRLLSGARRVLLLWVGDPRDRTPPGEEDFEYCLSRFSARFPQAVFDLLAILLPSGGEPHPQVPSFGVRGNCTTVVFDYTDHEPGGGRWAVRLPPVARFLRGISVSDYRTRTERKAFRLHCRKERYNRYHATSTLDYWITDLKYKVFRHLQKRLERRGVRLP